MVAPVFVPAADGGSERRFFVAARGHHADIGGITPGSMPPFSRTIDEEGALFDGVGIVRDGHFDEDTVREVLRRAHVPRATPIRTWPI